MRRTIALALAGVLAAGCGPGTIDMAEPTPTTRRAEAPATTDQPATTAEPTTSTAAPTTAAPTTIPEPVVTYEVIGSGTATVTYGTAGFGQEQHSVTLPWQHEISGAVPDFPVIVAQQDGSGEITCKIWQGGTEPSAQATSSGAYAVVTCADD